MTPPEQRLLDAVDATWPAAETVERAGWALRRGAGGGKRVSAASALAPGTLPDVAAAISALGAWDQLPLFRLGGAEAELDALLAQDGFEVIDPVVFYAAPVAALLDGADETARVIRCRAPLKVLDEIWDEGGIGPARRDVMDRAAGPSVRLMARLGDRPVGAAFVALDAEIAMIHAIEVTPSSRRNGAGALLMRGAASFAAAHGAMLLALAVTEANGPARALYERLGMGVAGRYHYRIRDRAMGGE